MGIFSFRQQLTYAVLLFLLLLLAVPRAGHDGDMYFWLHWATHIFEHGLPNAYQLPDNNYNPFFHYILWLYGRLLGSVEKLQYYIHLLKAFPLLFDFAGAFWAASLVPERSRRFGLMLLLLFNIGYLYNTLIWIQVDSIYTFFAFGSVVLAVQQRAVGSALCFVLALAAKTQAIIFLPPLLLLWLPLWWHRPQQLVWTSVASVSLATLVLAPFIWWSSENYLPRIIELNLKAAEVYPRVSMGAFNSWYLLLPGASPLTLSDQLPWVGLTYRGWGLVLFCAFSALALLPLLVVTVRAMLPRLPSSPAPTPDMSLVLLSCGVIPLLFSFFNTQMHERYWHAAVLFLAAYGFLRRDYLPYVLVSVAYFLNLESILHYLQLLKYGVLLFDQRFIAGLFGLSISLALVKIYRLTPWRLVPLSATGAALPIQQV
jgi:Gpi18-like mannosyltransferase